MTVQLLKTKLHIPAVHPQQVSRPRLIERLDAGLRPGCRLVLVSAPAGYGKTTLLSEWARSHSTAWLTLDSRDNDPIRFATHLVAALQTLDAATGQEVLDALHSLHPPSLEDLFAALVNQLDTIVGPFALVLDDYHLIASLPIHQALVFLIDHLPLQMRVIIATRSDPLLPMARLRGRGQLLELRQDDLRFTADEAARFLQQTMELALSASDTAALAERTEGWVAGLQMAALSLRGQPDPRAFIQSFGGSHRYIMDYLLAEVLNHQSVEVQRFLLHTCILERMTAPLCDVVMQEGEIKEAPAHAFAGSQATLDYLERTNLFLVPLDDERRWYRYHHLFADLLRQRLRQSAGPEAIAALRLRAAAWYEREGLVVEAVACSLAAPDHAYAAQLIARHALPLFYRGETVLLYGWLQALPEAILRVRPLLCALYAGCLVLVQQSAASFGEAEAWLDAAEAALEQGSPVAEAADAPARDETAGFVLQSRAYLARYRGDPPEQVVARSLHALERLPAGDLWFRSALYFNLGVAYWDLGEEQSASGAWAQARRVGEACGDLFNAVGAVAAQAAAACLRGRLHEAAAIYRQALQDIVLPAERGGRRLPIAGILHVGLGAILVEWNDLDEAERALECGLALLALTMANQSRYAGYFALARLKQAQGDGDGALRVLEQAEQLYPRAVSGGPSTPFRAGAVHVAPSTPFRAEAADVAPYRLRLWLQQAGDDPRRLAEAERWAREQGMALDAGPDRVAQLAFARLVLAQHRLHMRTAQAGLPALCHLLDRQAHWAQANGRVGQQIELSILQALARQLRGDLEGALDALQRALALAEPEGYVRIFLDEGPPLAELLRLGRQRDAWCSPRLPAYVDRLLAAFPPSRTDRGADQPVSPAPPSPAPGLIEPLSERELEVLRLIGDGLSNRQIAAQLVVTVGTVKTHAHNVYAKLGVARRTEAVARARELDLL